MFIMFIVLPAFHELFQFSYIFVVVNREENQRFSVLDSHCLEKTQMSFFHVVVLKIIATKNTTLRRARAARIFFLN